MNLRNNILGWVSCLARRSRAFGGLAACPCAANARFACIQCADARELSGLLECLGQVPANFVLIVAVEEPSGVRGVLYDHRAALHARGMLALASDPTHPFVIRHRRTTQDGQFLVLVQNKLELERTAERLQRTGYYQHWTAEQRAWLEDRQ